MSDVAPDSVTMDYERYVAVRDTLLRLKNFGNPNPAEPDVFDELFGYIDALHARLAEAEADRKRLDFIESMGVIHDHAPDANGYFPWRFGIAYVKGTLVENVSVTGPRDLRAATDAAMAGR